MKRCRAPITVLLFLLLSLAPAWARQRAAGWCEAGAQKVTLAGLSSATNVQASYPSCTVTVYISGTSTRAVLYSSSSGTSLGNPFTASSNGSWYFYADNGMYDIQLSGAGFPTPVTLAAVQLYDPGLAPPSFAGIRFASFHNFAAITPNVALTAATAATVTFSGWAAPPPGVIAGDRLYISQGTGTPEVVTVSNVGAACPSGTAASVCFTPANSHSGAWTLQSATGGIQEAINVAGTGGWVMVDQNTTIYTDIVIDSLMHLSGFVGEQGGTEVLQATANTDDLDVGDSGHAPTGVVIDNIAFYGVKGDGTDSGVDIHCVNCVGLKLTNVLAYQAHDGLFFDSTYGHAFDGNTVGSHFLNNYIGVHIVGGSANRLTFTGDTVDGNQYGVFDDGGWVHSWVGNDIENNSLYGYWQQVSNPASYSAHNVLLQGNYFETNGNNTAGHGDIFLGQLVGGGSGNNGDGCINCEVTDNLFNASPGGNTTALSFGAVTGYVAANTYSGYGPGKIYAYINGPSPNFTRVISLGDGGNDTGATAVSGAYGGSRYGTVTRIDNTGTFTIGGWDQLTDNQGSPLRDTTIESPTGNVAIRGVPGGATVSNPATLWLEGNSTGQRGDSILFRNNSTNEYQINNDPYGSNSHDMCLLNDYANPSQAQCLIYVNPQGKIKFGNPGPSGTLATRTQDYQFSQLTNGDDGLVVNRHQDTGCTGNLLNLQDSTLSSNLFTVSCTGQVTSGSWNNSNSAFTIGPLSASTGNFTGAVTMGAGSTMGGKAINTDTARVGAQSGTLFASTTVNAGTCVTGGISFGSGVALGMAVSGNPESVPPASLSWNFIIDAANHVTVRLCNWTTSNVTWTSGAVWDVRVEP